jgi:hypothetical protein
VSSTTLPKLLDISGNGPSYVRFEGTSFEWNISGVTDPGAIFRIQTLNQPLSLQVVGCSFTGWASGGNKFTAFSSISSANFNAVFDNCTGLRLTSTYSGAIIGTNWQDPNQAATFLFQSGEPNGAFRYEQRNGLTEWDPDAAPPFPTLTAMFPDGATKWSSKSVWLNSLGPNVVNEFKAARLRQICQLSTGVRTITVQLFMRTALASALTLHKMVLVLTYVNASSGAMETKVIGAVPVSSAVSWDGAGSWSGYAAYKMAYTTPVSVLAGSEITASLTFAGQPGTGQNENVFVDPEFGVA